MKVISIIILFSIFLSIPCLAYNEHNALNLLLSVPKIQPIHPPDVKDVYGTREVESEENTARLGTGLKSMCIFFPETVLGVYFNRDHGLEIAVGIFNIYSISYKRLLYYKENKRQYLSLGGMGHANWQTPSPIIKLTTEIGEYRGRNITFEIGIPVIVGIGIMTYI